jgi:lipopolysaccharide export LptBFGC system permease protein LptF
MLYIYGTVFNSSKRVLQSISSINKINMEKKFFITDNFSTDGTYELLIKNKEFNITVIRKKCTRGKGRNIAMDRALKEASDNDIFMFIDLDEIYSPKFIRLIEYEISILDDSTVYNNNHISFCSINRLFPWRDLTASEDVEREARIVSEGYNLIEFEDINSLKDNENVPFDRERRYAHGFLLYRRRLRSYQDYLRGAGCRTMANFLFYIRNARVRKKFYPFYFIIFLDVKLFKEIYSYSGKTNIELLREKVKKKTLPENYIN